MEVEKQFLLFFREGVVMNTPVKPGKGSAVNVGLLKPVRVDKVLTPG